MKVMAAGDDHKFTVFGGVEYQTGNIISYQSEDKDSEAFIHWLQTLIRDLPEKPILVVLDNARYHKSHQCWKWWQQHSEHIRPFFLPAYAPHLNLIERVWRFLKSKLSCHRWWADMPGLMIATEEILKHLHINFYAEGQPSIALVQEFCPSA
jgi:transposase